jgi:hypothetical protein
MDYKIDKEHSIYIRKLFINEISTNYNIYTTTIEKKTVSRKIQMYLPHVYQL